MKIAPLILVALVSMFTILDKTAAHLVRVLGEGDNPPRPLRTKSASIKAHLNNFRLFEEAGDAVRSRIRQVKRGIVVFCVKTSEEVIAAFGADPYVQKGFMKAEAFAVTPEFGKLNISGIDPTGIVENRIAILESASPNAPPEVHDQHLAYLQKEGPKVELAFYGKLSGPQSIRGIALFRGKDDSAITAWLEQAPLVKAGTLKYTLMPQWRVLWLSFRMRSRLVERS